MKKERKCLHCQETIRGRADKKFCDADCRSAYHNEVNRSQNMVVKSINSKLRTNRKILEQLYSRSIRRVNRMKLIELGYSFSFATSFTQSSSGLVEQHCYDFGIIDRGDGLFNIVCNHSEEQFISNASEVKNRVPQMA